MIQPQPAFVPVPGPPHAEGPGVRDIVARLEKHAGSVDAVIADACADLIVLAGLVQADLEMLRLAVSRPLN